MTNYSKSFPQEFSFGATSSFQIEGYTHVDGRGESIWDRFCATEGKVKNGDDGTRACEHFARYPEDIKIMKDLGVQSYRFSIAWPRIPPTGLETSGNTKGLDFYNRLVDALLEAGIEPWVTSSLGFPHGFTRPRRLGKCRIIDQFSNFLDIMSRSLGDRVTLDYP